MTPTLTGVAAVLWDFDGVIIHSGPVRDKGFEAALQEFSPEQVARLLAYHHENGGLSRYKKFRYFYEEILGQSVTEERIRELSDGFSSIMRESLTDRALLIEDSVSFIRAHHTEVPMHVVSGSDGNELRFLADKLGISEYFVSIHGSPTPKVELVGTILESYGYSPESTVFIGDSHNDYDAAAAHGLAFWGYRNERLKDLSPFYVDSFAAVT